RASRYGVVDCAVASSASTPDSRRHRRSMATKIPSLAFPRERKQLAMIGLGLFRRLHELTRRVDPEHIIAGDDQRSDRELISRCVQDRWTERVWNKTHDAPVGLLRVERCAVGSNESDDRLKERPGGYAASQRHGVEASRLCPIQPGPDDCEIRGPLRGRG